MEQIITEVVLKNKAMVRRTTSLISLVFMQLGLISVFYFVKEGNKTETTAVLMVILILSVVLMVVRIVSREPWKIVFKADQVNLHYLFVTKSVSSYDLSAINLSLVEQKPRKQVLVNQHLYKAPYSSIQMIFGDRQLHLLPMYLGAKNNNDLPGHRKMLEQFLDRLLEGRVLPEVPVER